MIKMSADQTLWNNSGNILPRQGPNSNPNTNDMEDK